MTDPITPCIIRLAATETGASLWSNRSGNQPGVSSEAGEMVKNEGDEKPHAEILERFQAMSRGRKIVLVVFVIWAIQAIPKWTAAETSAKIMRMFVTPRA